MQIEQMYIESEMSATLSTFKVGKYRHGNRRETVDQILPPKIPLLDISASQDANEQEFFRRYGYN